MNTEKKYVEVKAFSSISTKFMIKDYFANKLEEMQVLENNQIKKQ